MAKLAGMTSWRTPPTLLVLAALAGCGDKSADSATPECSGLAVELGEGEFAFAPRSDGDAVTMVHGPQGGWHIDIAGRVSGSTGTVSLVPSVLESNQQVSLAGIGQENEPPFELVGWTARSCTGTFFRLRAIIDDVDPGGPYQRFICTLNDNPLTVSVEATDTGSGETVSASFNAIAKLDPDDVPICSSY